MKAQYRILTADKKIKYAGSNTGSWFTLQQARNLVDRKKGETIYLYCMATMERMFEILN